MAALALCLSFVLACAGDREPAPEPRVSDEAVLALARAMAERLGSEPVRDAGMPDAATPRLVGEFQLTYYWMAREDDGPEPRDVTLYTRKCQILATVSRSFHTRLMREGTGRLRDGRTINTAGDCACQDGSIRSCYFAVSRRKRWGVGVAKRPLSPYRSVAVDPETIPIGTKLYIPALEGLTMPGRRPYGGFVHDGCVVADDTGASVGSGQIDLFMAFKVHYEAFDRRHRLKRVEVYDGEKYCSEPAREAVPAHRNAT